MVQSYFASLLIFFFSTPDLTSGTTRRRRRVLLNPNSNTFHKYISSMLFLSDFEAEMFIPLFHKYCNLCHLNFKLPLQHTIHFYILTNQRCCMSRILHQHCSLRYVYYLNVTTCTIYFRTFLVCIKDLHAYTYLYNILFVNITFLKCTYCVLMLFYLYVFIFLTKTSGY